MAAEKIFTAEQLDQLEASYRSGMESVKKIAKRFNVSDTSVHKLAKKYGWERDLKTKIQARAKAILLNDQALIGDKGRGELEIVEAAAKTQVAVINSHRVTIDKFKKLIADLLAEIEVDADTDEDGNSIPRRVDCTKKLSETFKTMAGLERQAYGIADDSDGNSKPDNSGFTVNFVPVNRGS